MCLYGWLVNLNGFHMRQPRQFGVLNAGEGLGIVSITLWELAVLFALGRLRASGTVEESLRSIVHAAGVTVKDITATIASLATQFPDNYPADPADRLIGATARAEGLVLVTRDKAIRASSLIKTRSGKNDVIKPLHAWGLKSDGGGFGAFRDR